MNRVTAGNPRMKRVRACLVLLALCPGWSFADGSGTADDPYVEGIQCNGNVTTSCEFIRTQTDITVGKALDEVQVENARLRLETLPAFRAVQIHLIKGSHKHWVIVVIDVTEANPVTSAVAVGTLAQLANQAAAVETLAGRVTNHDLFGSGKTLDLSMVLARPFEGGGGQEYAARLQYSDPTLFDSRKYFFTAGAFYTQADLRFSNPSGLLVGTGYYQNSGAGVDFSVGMHLDTYSYVTVGYRYLQNTARNDQYLVSDGVIQTFNSSPGNVLLFTVGRNTEDDPSFPTHGWLLHAYDGWGRVSTISRVWCYAGRGAPARMHTGRSRRVRSMTSGPCSTMTWASRLSIHATCFELATWPDSQGPLVCRSGGHESRAHLRHSRLRGGGEGGGPPGDRNTSGRSIYTSSRPTS